MGFVVRFEDSPTEAANRQTDIEPTSGNDHRVALIEAQSSDALEFPLAATPSAQPSLEAAADASELIELADKAFPAKFAYFVTRSSSLLRPAEIESLELSVRRDFIVEESLEFLGCMKESQLHSVLRINFTKESGIDAGGVHREWFMLLSELVVDPTLGLFTCTSSTDQTYYLDALVEPSAGERHLAQVFAIGRLVGRALLEGEVLGFHLALPLLKIVLGYPLTWEDLALLDPVMHKNLKWMLQNDGADRLGVDFTVTKSASSSEVVELIPGGSHTPVTDSNKQQYVERLAQYLLVERVSEPLHAFLQGLYQVVPRQILLLFDAEEFDYLLCGSDTIDVGDWERHTKCSKSLRNSRVLRWFWQLVRDMPHEYRRRLLQFATGCSRVPLVGFRGLTSYDGRICPFTLKGVPYEESAYVRSHACFNRLDLPLYKTRGELRAVLYAVLDTEMYGFTTA